MKLKYIWITISAFFPTSTLNWQVLWGMDEYLLNSLYEKLKNKVSLKHVNSKESFSSKDKHIN